jgi:hypothetical protein
MSDDQVREAAEAFKLEKKDESAYALTVQDVIDKLTELGVDIDSNEALRLYDLFVETYTGQIGGFKQKSLSGRFSRCVKKVRKTVSPRKGSTKESAAIGICVKSVLHTRGRTLKRYSKKRLVTQKRK